VGKERASEAAEGDEVAREKGRHDVGVGGL